MRREDQLIREGRNQLSNVIFCYLKNTKRGNRDTIHSIPNIRVLIILNWIFVVVAHAENLPSMVIIWLDGYKSKKKAHRKLFRTSKVRKGQGTNLRVKFPQRLSAIHHLRMISLVNTVSFMYMSKHKAFALRLFRNASCLWKKAAGKAWWPKLEGNEQD